MPQSTTAPQQKNGVRPLFFWRSTKRGLTPIIYDIKQSLTLDGASLTPKAPLAGTSGKAQVFSVEGHPTIKEVEFHPGGGTHGDSPYYKLVSTEKIGNKNIEIRVIDPSPDFSPGTITRYRQYYDTQGNRLKYEGGEWKGWK